MYVLLCTADLNGSASPEAWVAAVVNNTAAATAQQLEVPQTALRVTFEASLGSGLHVPAVPSARQQAAVDALAEFFEETTGTTGLLVGLNIVPAPGTATAHANTTNKGADQASAGSTAAGTVLALATLNGPIGDLAHVLRMADMQEHRCPELFQLSAVLQLSAPGSFQRKGSTPCAAWLSDWYMPVLRPDTKAPALPPGAAALQAARPPDVVPQYQAGIALPLEVRLQATCN